MSIQRYDINPPSLVEEGYPETTPNNDDGQIVYYTDHVAELHHLLSTLADIREALGVGEKPMLSELAGIIRTRMGVIKILERDAADHAAEVERLTAENKKYVDDLVNRGTIMLNVLTAERGAAVARAERAEEALRVIYNVLVEINPNNHDEDDVFTQNNSVIEAIQIASTILAALTAAPDHIGDVTEMVAPDKPQYAALSPEPWGGPEGEEEAKP